MHAPFGTLQGFHTQLGRDPFDPGRDYIVEQLGRLYFISHLERGGGEKSTLRCWERVMHGKI